MVTSDNAVGILGSRGSFQFSLRTLFAFVTWVMVTGAMIAWLARAHWGVFVGPLYIVSTIALIALACLTIKSGMIRFGVATVAMPFVAMFFIVEIELLKMQLRSNPPPRPMFHNDFVDDSRHLFPIWIKELTVRDQCGNIVAADYDDNVLFAEIGSAADEHGVNWTGFNDGIRFYFDDGSIEKSITVKRTTNELVVISSSGLIDWFPIKPGVARTFHKKHRGQFNADLFVDLRKVLDAESRQRLDAFLSVANPVLCGQNIETNESSLTIWL